MTVPLVDASTPPRPLAVGDRVLAEVGMRVVPAVVLATTTDTGLVDAVGVEVRYLAASGRPIRRWVPRGRCAPREGAAPVDARSVGELDQLATARADGIRLNAQVRELTAPYRGVDTVVLRRLLDARVPGVSCRAPGADPEDWFPVDAPRATSHAYADQLCGGCPLRGVCLEWSLRSPAELRSGVEGIWGGLTRGGREIVLRSRRQAARHATTGRGAR